LLDTELRATIATMPKIELHRHLEGSLRLDTLVDIAREHGIEMPDYNVETLRPFVQMMPGEPRSAKHFLSKFAMLRQFYRTTEIIKRITREIVADAASDNVRYMELRFTPKALCNITERAIEEIVPLVCDAGNEAAAAHGIIVRYIVSMNRHEPVALGEPVLRAAIANRERGVVGLDLAGNEAEFSCLPFRSLFHRAKAAGLGVTIHAGEWAGADSVWDAIGNLGASRVGHGINVLQDPALVQVLVDREITLEVCPSSNYLSGIVDALKDHPLQALTRRHVLTTLNTDDPLLCNITLSREIEVVMEHMEITLDDIKQYMLRAARAAFLPALERENLIRQFQNYMATVKV
jgi:adenosine deaminase